ncbi:MAG: tannase/feruloyl esterase family alpha/beta hydrolase [Alphaproteobacteria bacterium]|nr:tannase/feruloyl esterase family alpha/beta hydrolase [Alphaproteobacteria bacterium]
MRTLPIAILGLLLSSAPALAFDCTALTGTAVPKSAIGLPTSGAVVASASLVTDPRNGTYCKLTGGIKPVDTSAPDILFQVNLPEHWNGKALQFGGGGLNGTVVTGERSVFPDPAVPMPLSQGYVTFGSDSGHKGTGADGSFGLNAEALNNYLGAHLKKTHDLAMALIQRVYHARPRRSYFMGSSTGGREALLAAERRPGDYDGIISVHPAFDLQLLGAANMSAARVIFGQPGAWIPPAKLSHISVKVLEACDGLDGLKDGVIGNVKACDTAFDPASLRCAGGADMGVECLSDAQMASLRLAATPRKPGVMLSGMDTLAPYPLLESDIPPSGTIFGRTADIHDSFLGALGSSAARFIVMQDANYDTTAYDPAQHAGRLQQLSKEGDVIGALVPFAKRGGKLLLMHGTSDMLIPPGNSVVLYERLQAAHGTKLPQFARFYMAPGFGHGNGNFRLGWDALGVLDAWVTKGKAPGPQIITDTNTATLGRKRPLCEYPAWPKYNGSGDAIQASSFSCTAP